MADSPQGRLCVIYSMGRVGSRSLYEELQQRGYPCKHSHFLSDRGFAKTVEALTRAGVGALELKHWTGQLIENLDTRRRLETYRRTRQGPEPVLVTLVRDPSTWFLSNMVQNWEGISAGLRDQAGNRSAGDAELAAMLYGRTEAVLERLGAIALNSAAATRESVNMVDAPLDRMLLNMILEPYLWLEEEYCAFTGVLLEEFREIGPAGKVIETGYGHSVVGRFEDLPQLRETLSDTLGLELHGGEVRRNVSEEAPAHSAIKRQFGEFHDRVRAHPVLREAAYRRLFHY